MGYDIKYAPHTAIKLQALVDFIVEWTEVQTPTPEITHEYCTLYFDGSVMAPGAGAGVVLISAEGNKLRYAIRIYFLASNNIAEYEGDGICGTPKCFSTWARFASSVDATSSSTTCFLASGALEDVPDPSGISNPAVPRGFTTNESASPDSDSSSSKQSLSSESVESSDSYCSWTTSRFSPIRTRRAISISFSCLHGLLDLLLFLGQRSLHLSGLLPP
jgi:hypothetical protein